MIHCENSKCKYYFEDSCITDLNGGIVSLDSEGKCDRFEEGVCEWYEESECE